MYLFCTHQTFFGTFSPTNIKGSSVVAYINTTRFFWPAVNQLLNSEEKINELPKISMSHEYFIKLVRN